MALRSNNRLDEAIASQERAIQLEPGLALAHGALGVALQAAARLDEAVAAQRRALTLDPSSAAALQGLDLLISVDTATAHLAGALGRMVWVLLPFAPDWRWLLGRGDSPWYTGMRLFRQSSPGDWAPVMERVRAELQKMIGESSAG